MLFLSGMRTTFSGKSKGAECTGNLYEEAPRMRDKHSQNQICFSECSSEVNFLVDVSKSYFRKEKKKRNLLEEIECSTMTPSEFASMVDDSELLSKGFSVRAQRKRKRE